MRLLGLGQLWNTGLRLVSVMFLCQLLSPLVALLAIVVSGSEMAGEAESHTRGPIPPDITSIITEATSQVTEATEASECCDLTRQTAPCPSDHVTSPSLCQDPEVACSELPLQCVRCQCDYNCSYGKQSLARCSADTAVLCSGDRNFTRQFTCSYCFLSDEKLHKCSNRDIGKSCSMTQPDFYPRYFQVVAVSGLRAARPTGTSPTAAWRGTPSVWARLSSPSGGSATGLRATAGPRRCCSPSPWAGSGRTDSTWATGRRE